MKNNLLFLIPLLPLAGAFLNLFVWRLLFPTTGKYRQSDVLTHTTAIVSVLGAFIVSLFLVTGPLLQNFSAWNVGDSAFPGLHQSLWTWIEVGTLKIQLAFRLDTLTAVMLLVITGIGTLIHIYSVGYMHGEKRYPAFFGYLNLFTGMMLILVLGDSLPIMFIGWEGVGLCSYLLIGFWFTKTENADAGRKAFITNRVGDFAFLLGICLLFYTIGSVSFSDLQSAKNIDLLKSSFLGLEYLSNVDVIALLFFVGACGKSAQIPLYVWLPDAMAGPTPVSALIHAATMVTAGVYMITRMSFLYAHSTLAMGVVAGVGALTALFAAIMAFSQTDLKKVLAYSTVSQLGFMFVGVGVGAYTAGIFHLITHAFFKAGLFLAAGSVMHAMSGSGDIMKMGGLRKKLRFTHFSFIIYCLAISGFPLLSGFFSKDEILAGAFGANAEGWLPMYGKLLWVVLSVAALGTAFYMFRLYFLVFAGENRSDPETKAHIHESPFSMTGPLLILAFFAAFIGVIGLPHLSSIHLPTLLHHWLQPVLIDFGQASLLGENGIATVKPAHMSDALTLGLMGVASFVGIVGIGAAYLIYGRGPSAKVDSWCDGGLGSIAHKLSANKFYVDELYELIIYKPFRWLANVLYEVFDRFLIDLIFVNGSAFLIDAIGRLARFVQNGQVQRYMAAVVIGGALLFYCGSKPKMDFYVEQNAGYVLEFSPELGQGLDSQNVVVEFDMDGDGKADKTRPYNSQKAMKLQYTFPKPGFYEIKMTIRDAVFDEEHSMTKTVQVKDFRNKEVRDSHKKGGAL